MSISGDLNVSTYQLAESVAVHFGNKSSVDEVLKCWYGLGNSRKLNDKFDCDG